MSSSVKTPPGTVSGTRRPGHPTPKLAGCPFAGAPPSSAAAPASPLPAAPEEAIRAAITAMVAEGGYPCLGAKSVFKRDQVQTLVMDRLADPDGASRLYRALTHFASAHPRTDSGDQLPNLASFVVAFRGPLPTSELEFENLLWRQLVQLHEVDEIGWDPRVSPDPASPQFGFSVAGRAFFVIGMHPSASRIARRAPLPLLVFNLHNQFEQLRAAGRYERVRDVVRRRDLDLQGRINPMVADHGSRSEARQYSGRAVAEDWTPPYAFGTEISRGQR